MRSTIIIHKRGTSYISDVSGQFGGGCQGARAGLTAEQAAITASRLILRYAQSNPERGDLIAPDEVIKLVPAHLHSIKGRE